MTGLCAGSFFYVWYCFAAENNQTGHLLGYGNLAMSLITYIVLFIVVGRWMHAFKIGVERIANELASTALTIFVVDFLEVFVSMVITGQFRFFGEFFVRYLALALIQTPVLCVLNVLMIRRYRKIFPPLQILEICGQRDSNLDEKINGIPSKYHVAAHIDSSEPEEQIRKAIKNYDAVLINDLSAKEQNRMEKLCFAENKRVYLVPKISDIIVKSSENLNVVDTPLFLNRNSGMGVAQRFFKRLFDILLSGLAVGVLSPLFLITAIAIKAEDHGPVFYRQERVTMGGRHFMILKFRSMIVDAEKDGRPHPAGEKDDRITGVGRVIRSCRIDELPQLINILKGDMSIVGPRPERVEHVEEYTREIPEFRYRLKVRGGLTGYAQVYGKYNTSALDKLKLDMIYITNYSFLLDVQIIFETIKILFQKESTEGFSQAQAEKMHDAQPEEETDNVQKMIKMHKN